MPVTRKTAPFLGLATLTAFAGLAALGLTATSPVRADIVATDTAGSFQSGVAEYFGQSFTVATPGPESNIQFNFYSNFPATTPFALGTAFLFNTAYVGTPAALSPAATGFLGQATASGNVYAFAPNLTLQPGTQYFLYENALIPLNGITGGDAIYTGGKDYFTSTSSSNYTVGALSTNFLVTGTAVSNVSVVPESSGLANLSGGLLALGAAGLLLYVRRHKAKPSA